MTASTRWRSCSTATSTAPTPGCPSTPRRSAAGPGSAPPTPAPAGYAFQPAPRRTAERQVPGPGAQPGQHRRGPGHPRGGDTADLVWADHRAPDVDPAGNRGAAVSGAVAP